MSIGGSKLTVSAPVQLFENARFVSSSTSGFAYYDIARDGRFIMVEELPGGAAPTELIVVTDWTSELRRKLATP